MQRVQSLHRGSVQPVAWGVARVAAGLRELCVNTPSFRISHHHHHHHPVDHGARWKPARQGRGSGWPAWTLPFALWPPKERGGAAHSLPLSGAHIGNMGKAEVGPRLGGWSVSAEGKEAAGRPRCWASARPSSRFPRRLSLAGPFFFPQPRGYRGTPPPPRKLYRGRAAWQSPGGVGPVYLSRSLFRIFGRTKLLPDTRTLCSRCKRCRLLCEQDLPERMQRNLDGC